eukprot:Gregarina_sp_Poly_1__5103@NODE_2700_length_1810_cov_76_855422_g1713_i0_p1_GENE_NODE_2700_length_1810_cov_76_855422_g1713_i0NODE_2700_length_1810_cov_76_855422_g1713_i0_p1_ORF_typecomplete_len388_score29_69Pkinase/PF00069_25/2_1e63Pkinase_Tyr/PF07714_17/1_1e35Kinaselike/PF14531_6/1e15Kdo/PF06293_14/1_4e07FTA2/PF13095_6/96FTA2/PF13095_6/0_0006Pkinase_fungal/PF17667_1/6_3e05WaaY/PF06176_11/0_00021APH/PF01636_23/0_0072APH/PF01636_23/6_5e02RIO1/PF01163_22/0_022YrbLPhoP_reg/PF10707_9/0_087Choline_kina
MSATADPNGQTRSRSSRYGNRIFSTTKTYEIGRVLGNGSFGVVCEARCIETNEQVAIKKVLQDPRYKNRELDVMKQLYHPNVVALRDYFYTEGQTSDGEGIQRYLSVVMEFVPETVYKVLKSYTRAGGHLPMPLVQVYTYQMIRSLGYLHSLGVCHRDIKPQNLLVDIKTHVLKLCDFGSAKKLFPGESSVSYICSRFYRAPELMLGATEYTCAIDTWSMGCVLAELLTGKPLFAGETSVDQLVKIIQVLGAPTKAQMNAMNRQYADFHFPDFRSKEWHQVLQDAEDRIPQSACDLLSAMLRFVPSERVAPYEALAHPFFDSLREPGAMLPGNIPLPPLFNFSDHELRQMTSGGRTRVMPSWVQDPNGRGSNETPHIYSNSGRGTPV